MKDFVVLQKTSEKTDIFLFLDLKELTEMYYENKFFRRDVDNGRLIIYVRDPKKIQGMLHSQHNLDIISDKLMELIQ